MENLEARTWLQNIFDRRKLVQKPYSLRSFSKDVGLSPGSVSEILKGKRPLTVKQAKKIAVALKLPDSQLHALIELISLEKKSIPEGKKKKVLKVKYRTLLDDEFNLICEPHHFYILKPYKDRKL